MGGDASETLGAQEVAGTFVGPKGLTRRIAAGSVGGIVGGVLASAVGGGSRETPKFGNLGYVAITADEVAIVKGKAGLVSPRIGKDVVARAPRAEITTAEYDKGALKSALRISFGDGGLWEFEIARRYHATAERVARELGATGI